MPDCPLHELPAIGRPIVRRRHLPRLPSFDRHHCQGAINATKARLHPLREATISGNAPSGNDLLNGIGSNTKVCYDYDYGAASAWLLRSAYASAGCIHLFKISHSVWKRWHHTSCLAFVCKERVAMRLGKIGGGLPAIHLEAES